MFIQYTHYTRNGTGRIASLNVNKIANVILHETDEDPNKITAMQILLDVPTTQVWREVPNKARIDREGRIAVNKAGVQEIDFVRKQEQQHIIINILNKEEIVKIAAELGLNLEGKEFSSLLDEVQGVAIPEEFSMEVSEALDSE